MKDKIKSLFIFSLCCGSAALLFADVICIENGDGSWTCSGFGQGNIIITNVVGTCTNCVGVTPQFCQNFKDRIMETCDYIHDNILNDIDSSARQAISRLSYITNELSSFRQVTGNQSISYMQNNYPQAVYCRDPRGGTNIENWSAGATYNQNYYAVCINSLYSYATTAMQPLQYVGDDLQDLTWQGALGDIEDQLYQLNTLADSMDCSACKATFGDDSEDDKPQGGIAQEQLDALMRILNEKKAIAEDIRHRMIGLTNYIAHIDKNLYTIADESIYITNFVHRLDDYVFDDFTNRVYVINNDVHLLAQALSNDLFSATGIYTGLFSSFSNANVFANVHWDTSAFDGEEGEWERLGKEIANNRRNEGDPEFIYSSNSAIDFAKYQRLNYFQRLEFLLGNLNGIFNEGGTNTIVETSADFTDEQQSKIDEVESAFDDYTEIFESPRDKIQGWITRLQQKKDSINPFKGLLDNGEIRYLTFLPETEYTFGQNTKLTIPKIVLEWDKFGEGQGGVLGIMYVSNGLFHWLWVIMGLVFFFLIIYRFITYLIKLLGWYYKIVHSYYTTLFLG